MGRLLMPGRVIAGLAALALTGCLSGCGAIEALQSPAVTANASITGSVAPVTDALTGSQTGDPVSLGKRHLRDGNYGLAEEHFRKAVEQGPRDVEAWIGLAAAYDRLHRFELADRAYDNALRLTGPTAMILNNQGYSYLLRGDLKRAQSKLAAAKALDPGNINIQANLALLTSSKALEKDVR